MSLEKSTPYRNAWYRDLLEKEKELKEYTDEKVAQAIELPEVTSEDNGDLLAADDGSWVKSDKLKTIMNAGVEQVGKIPMVGDTGEWSLTDYPSNELPSVTSVDNGKVAGVVNGNWDKMDIPNELPEVTLADDGNVLQVVNGEWNKSQLPTSGTVVFNGTISGANLNLADNKTINDIVTAIDGGKSVSIETRNEVFILTEKGTTSNIIVFMSVHREFNVTNMYMNLIAIAVRTNLQSTNLIITRYNFLEYPSQAGNILVSRSGAYDLIKYPVAGISNVDNGKTIVVKNGAWSREMLYDLKSLQFVNGQALSDADYASIKANTNVRGIYSDASKYIIFDLSSCNFAQTEFEFVNYKEGLKATIDTTKVVTIASI